MSWFNNGKNDKAQNKGPKKENEFNNSNDREKYNAGYQQQKREEQQNNKK